MTIKTVEEYRAIISKQPKRTSGTQSTDAKYFVAGFLGAANAARSQENKANNKVERTR